MRKDRCLTYTGVRLALPRALGTGKTSSAISITCSRTHGVAKNRSEFAYLELDLPFVSSASGVAGVDRFSVSLSARAEDYSSFGSVTTPKVGVIYGPNPDFTVRGTWGKSFKAPTLGDRFSGQYGWIGWAVDDGYQGDPDFDGVDLYVTGGNPDLGPEKARQWTTSLSWHPQAFPGLQIDLSGFDIDYKDRIVEPIPNSVFALSNPAYGSFVILDPSADEYHAIADNLLEIDNRSEERRVGKRNNTQRST